MQNFDGTPYLSRILWEDDSCSATDGGGKAVDLYLQAGIHAFIGPPCSTGQF